MTPGLLYTLIAVAGSLLVVLRAARKRGRFFAIFTSLILGLQVSITSVIFDAVGWLQPLFLVLQLLVLVHFWALAEPEERPDWYRYTISIPGSAFAAGALLAMPWALLLLLGFDPWLPTLPYLLAAAGAVASMRPRVEDIDLVLDGRPVERLRKVHPGVRRGHRPLTIVQITDPHLGAFMTEERLAEICRRAVQRDPDLILLTGDYLTMETNNSRGSLGRALAPLQAAHGRVFAIRGNHDHEAPEEVARACEENGIRLLIDEAALIETSAGTVQILGMDHRWRGRKEHSEHFCRAHPRIPGALRLVLLHDPSAFSDLPDGEADLVLSGHTHGGQVGLLSLGMDWTFLSGFEDLPDHGFWGLGRNRMYVHRGTGHYGFPIRLGVPPEEGLLKVHLA